MKIVDLYTSNGDFVTQVLIPPFATGDPKIIFWGIRVFLWCETCKKYKEEFAVSAFTEDQLFKK